MVFILSVPVYFSWLTDWVMEDWLTAGNPLCLLHDGGTQPPTTASTTVSLLQWWATTPSPPKHLTNSPNTVFFTDPELKHTCMTHKASKSVGRAPTALATPDSYQFCPSDHHPEQLLNICAWWSERYCQAVSAVCALVEKIQIMIYLTRWRWSSVKCVIWLYFLCQSNQ